MTFILLVNSDFLLRVDLDKKYKKLNVKKVVDNMNRGGCISTDLMKSRDDQFNLGHNFEIGDYIELEKIGLAYLASSCYAMPGW